MIDLTQYLIDKKAFNILWFMISTGACLFFYHYKIMQPTIISVDRLRSGVESLLNEIEELYKGHDETKQRISRIEGKLDKG